MNVRQKILVIDDDNVIRMLIRRILERHGFEAILATNGKEGLESAAALFPDAILLDVNLPDLDGFQVCAKIRSQPATRQIPIILVTASDEPEARAHGLAQGANDYLIKPFNDKELIASLAKQLESSS